MSKKHYEAIAKVMCDSYKDVRPECYEPLDSLLGELVQIFKSDNSKFNKEKFLEAVHRCSR